MVRTLVLLIAAVLALAAPAARANPLGGQVRDGAATIAGEGTATVTVTQSTGRAVIDWRTFNIGAGEATRFFVPNSSSITVNRVTGGLGPSTIDGHLSSNGQLVLINPNGILFGLGSVVDAAGLVATSHDIANADFMAGRMVFDRPGNPAASVVNAGTITVADGGFAALVAPGVRNEGVITARLGKVGLAAGNGFTLDLYGDGLINLKVGDEIAAEVKDVRSGETLSSLVSNAGIIRADGGRVALTAVTARRVVDSVINNRGVIEANAVAHRGGTIILGAATAATKTKGAPTQTVKVSGTLTAAGQRAGQRGGKIKVTGEEIRIANARIDASGKAGGGTVLVGGDVRGGKGAPAGLDHPMAALESEAVPTAARVIIEPSVTIDVSATDTGNAGKAVVWSDDYTAFNGAILARGGPNGGNGGFVEISSAGQLVAEARADATAPAGTDGTILLDPLAVDIILAGQRCGAGRGCVSIGEALGSLYVWSLGDIFFKAAFKASGSLKATSALGSIYVKTAFSAADVVLTALGGIVFDAKVTATGNLTARAGGDIDVNAGLAVGETLALTSLLRGIDIDAAVTAADISLSAGGAVSVAAGMTATGALDVTASRLSIAAQAAVSAADISFEATSVTVAGTVRASNGLDVAAQSLRSTGLMSGEDVQLRLSPLKVFGHWVGGLDNQGTIAGSTIGITATGGTLDVGGTIALHAGAGPASRLSVTNASGPVNFAAALQLPAEHPALVSMVAGTALTVESDLAVQGAMLLHAGTDLRILGDINFTGVTLPATVALPEGLALTGQSLLMAVGQTVTGRGGASLLGKAAAASTADGEETQIRRTVSSVGEIAVVEQDLAANTAAAYLDGLTAGGLTAAFSPPSWITGSSANSPALAPVTASLTSAALSNPRGIAVPPPLADGTAATPAASRPAGTTTNPVTQIAATPPVDTIRPSNGTLIVDQTGGSDQGSPQQGQGGPSGQGGQQGQAGGRGPGGPGGRGGFAGRGPLPPMPRTFDVPPLTETRFVQNEVLLRLDAKLTPEQIAMIERQFGLTPLQRQDFGLGGFSFGRYRIPAGQDLRAVIAALSGNGAVMVGQPNYTYALSEDAQAPQDPVQGAAKPAEDQAQTAQPAPADGAQPASAPARALPSGLQLQYAVEKLRLPEAHQRARGREVLVAVIDSQIDAAHPELKDALRTVIDATGAGEAAEPHEHGTGMAGALAARAQLTGTAPASAIIGITAFRTDGKGTQGTTLSILNALDIAHREGARIVNMSFAGPRDPLLSRAIAEARQRGMILVAAAGNAGPKSPPLYPAADANVIAVTAIDADDNAFSMANRGSYVTVAAPGVDVLVPAPGGSYEFTSGTSVATAEISGLVALMLERDPSADVDDIKQALASSARDLGPKGPDPIFGAGAADAVAALQAMEFRTTATPRAPAPVASGPKPARPVAAAPGRSRLTPASLAPAGR